MRPVALGWKSWIHIGSPQAGPKVAAILSVVKSCRRLKLPVSGYLAAIPTGFADPDPAPPGPYSRCMGRPAFTDSRDGGVGKVKAILRLQPHSFGLATICESFANLSVPLRPVCLCYRTKQHTRRPLTRSSPENRFSSFNLRHSR
jgi:hypothetical protein